MCIRDRFICTERFFRIEIDRRLVVRLPIVFRSVDSVMSFSPEMIIKPSLIWFRRSTNSLSFSSESMKREKYVSGILPEIRQKEFRKSFDNILVMYTLRSRASGICYQSIKYGPVLRILHRQPSVEILQCFGRGFCMVFTIGTRNRLFQAVSYDRFQNTFICVDLETFP